MGKRKVFKKTDLAIPVIAHHRSDGNVLELDVALPPTCTLVRFDRNASKMRQFDFAPWYGKDIDAVTYACQIQVERFLAGQDTEVQISTVTAYCNNGMRRFLSFMVLRAAALRRPLTLDDIDRDLMDDYLRHLRERKTSLMSQKLCYAHAKPVLLALGRRGLIRMVETGEHATFPINVFPNVNRTVKSAKALPSSQRKAFTQAVKTAVMPLLHENSEPTAELLVYALLIVALHTGRNTTPLLEMDLDCLRPHPKDNMMFLVLWKRRGYNTSKVAVRADSEADRSVGVMPGVKPTVVRLIRRVIEVTASLRALAPDDLKNRVWLFRSQSGRSAGEITVLSNSSLELAIGKLVRDYGLVDTNGDPLQINVSRLRKTFANRIFELLDGDMGATAVALGNTVKVAQQSYLAPGEHAERNWKFLGQALTNELLTQTLGATERTPTGRCTDPQTGQFAPRKDGRTCTSFLDCLRCRNYVVTADDLYRLFSFYWRVLGERTRMEASRWKRTFAHIPRLIERDVIEAGVKRKIFRQAEVDAARERARRDPHPFWRVDTLASLEEFA